MTLVDQCGFEFSPEFAIAEVMEPGKRHGALLDEIREMPWKERQALALDAALELGWTVKPWIT